MAVNYDYTYNFLSFFGYQFAKKVMGGFWDTVARLGVDDNPYRAGFAQQICVSETDAQAEKDYLEHVTYFFNKCLHIPPSIFETPGYRTRRSTEFALKTNQPGEIAKIATLEKNWKTLVDNGFIIAGSPADGGRPFDRSQSRPASGQPDCPAADRIDGPRADQAEPDPFRRGRHAEDQGTLGRSTAGSTVGGHKAPARTCPRPSATPVSR